jgi:hypothetical protein
MATITIVNVMPAKSNAANLARLISSLAYGPEHARTTVGAIEIMAESRTRIRFTRTII